MMKAKAKAMARAMAMVTKATANLEERIFVIWATGNAKAQYHQHLMGKEMGKVETGEHDENGSEQGSGREEDHIPDTTLENQSKDDDEDTNERICMKIVSIIHDIGQTLREQENCPCEEEIDEITRNFSRISQNTVLQLSLAATIEHENAFMDSSHKSRTKQGGRDADLCSTSPEEDEDGYYYYYCYWCQ